MNNRKILLEFLKYSSLNVLGMLGISFYILADTFFIANGIGATGLAALNLAIPVFSLIHGLALMLGMGGATRFSVRKGQEMQEECNSIFSQTIGLALIISAVFMMIGILFSKNIAIMLGADRETFKMAEVYLKIILLFSPAFILNEIIICFVRNDGSPQLSTIGMLTGSIFNIIFDYIFIYPCKMGILGAVLATGFSPVISLIVLSIHFIKKNNTFKLIKTKLRFSQIIKIISIGFTSLVSELSSGIVIIIFNLIMLRLCGNIGVAAYGVVANISIVITALFTGIAQGSQPIISRNYGIGNTKNISAVLKYALSSVLIVSAVLYTLTFIFANDIASAFNQENNPELLKIATNGIKLYFSAIVFAGINIVLSIYFSAIEYTKQANIVSILRGLVVIIPMAFILSSLFGVEGLWLSFTATEFLVSVTAIVLFIIKTKK
ncbi:MAG: MATE family efflux transporter [Acutalibacteraceae bacterium]